MGLLSVRFCVAVITYSTLSIMDGYLDLGLYIAILVPYTLIRAGHHIHYSTYLYYLLTSIRSVRGSLTYEHLVPGY